MHRPSISSSANRLISLLGSNHRSAKHIAMLLSGSLIGSGSVFLVSVLLARKLGAADFGVFGSSYTIATLFSTLASFGIGQFWLKAFGKEGWGALRWLPPSLKWQAIIALLTLSVMYGWAYVGPHGAETRILLYAMGAFVVGQTIVELVSAKLQLEQRYTALSVWQLLPNLFRLLTLAIVFYAPHTRKDLTSISFVYGLTSFIVILVGARQIREMFKSRFALSGHPTKSLSPTTTPSILGVLSETWPFGLASVFAVIYMQIDIVMLKYISGNEQAASYNVGFVIVTISMMLPNVLYQKFLLPKYHRWANTDHDKLKSVYRFGFWAMIILGTLIFAAIISLSWVIIPLVFGEKYNSAVLIANVLALSIPIYFVAYNSGAVLVTSYNMRLKVAIMGAIAVLNVGINFVLIPRYSAMGAAASTIICYLALSVSYYVAAQRRVFFKEKM